MRQARVNAGAHLIEACLAALGCLTLWVIGFAWIWGLICGFVGLVLMMVLQVDLSPLLGFQQGNSGLCGFMLGGLVGMISGGGAGLVRGIQILIREARKEMQTNDG